MRTRVPFALLSLLAAVSAAGKIVPAVVELSQRDATALLTVDNPPSGAQAAFGVALFATLAASDMHLSEQGRAHLPEWLGRLTSGGSTALRISSPAHSSPRVCCSAIAAARSAG